MRDEVMVKTIPKKVKIRVSALCCVSTELSEFSSFRFLECHYEKRETWTVYLFLPLRQRKMMNVPIFCPIWMGSDELPAQKLGLTVSSIQNQEMSSPTASLLNNNFFTWSIGLLLFSVLIPEQALAPAPPPVQSANFITEVSPVRKTTQHLKSKSYFLKTITC